LQTHCCSFNGWEMGSKRQKGMIFKIEEKKNAKCLEEDHPRLPWKTLPRRMAAFVAQGGSLTK